MRGYCDHLEKQAEENTAFRRVLFTGSHSQLVVMSLLPNEEIGLETHTENDQFFRVEEGEAQVMIDDRECSVVAGDGILIPAGTAHNIINSSPTNPLKLYTIYSPPHHPDGTVHQTKAEAV